MLRADRDDRSPSCDHMGVLDRIAIVSQPSLVSARVSAVIKRTPDPSISNSLGPRSFCYRWERDECPFSAQSPSLRCVVAKDRSPPGEAVRGPSRSSTTLDPEPTAQTDPTVTLAVRVRGVRYLIRQRSLSVQGQKWAGLRISLEVLDGQSGSMVRGMCLQKLERLIFWGRRQDARASLILGADGMLVQLGVSALRARPMCRSFCSTTGLD